jgi:hypothetical protein
LIRDAKGGRKQSRITTIEGALEDMTLAVAWLRRIAHCEELIVAADSRLSGGRTLDSCAKILLLPRSDAFLCCAGETDITYPIAVQVVTAIGAYQRSADRALDLRDLRGHVLKILNKTASEIKTPVKDLKSPARYTEFLFGGYSWIAKQFFIWRLSYSKGDQKYFHDPAPAWFRGRHRRQPGQARAIFAGDWRLEARRRLVRLIRARHSITPHSEDSFSFDWEPFEILRDLLRENSGDENVSIGGPPQLAKIYQHMNSRYIGVYWPNRDSGIISIAGRSLLGYERTNSWILDPDTLKSEKQSAASSGAHADESSGDT